MDIKFRFISDPGHGWLEVPISFVRAMGIASKVSQYSYLKGDMAYLEEDCDAYLLLQELKRQNINYELDEVYQDPTPIRRYARFAA
jgi:hypothetical protein